MQGFNRVDPLHATIPSPSYYNTRDELNLGSYPLNAYWTRLVVLGEVALQNGSGKFNRLTFTGNV